MSQRIHFHSLDALRFFAFLKVYLLHIPLQGDFPIFSYLKSGGGIGVLFFFVLSGFLITYLLIHSKMSQGQVNLSNFFMRRSFRIWPLFFLMVILAFVLPYAFREDIGFHTVGGGYMPDWKFSFTFTENYKMLMEDNFPRTTPLPVFWSLCIEEHFYIVWMLVAFLLPVKHFFKFLIGCFVLGWIARYAEPHVLSNQNITTNDLFTNIDFFAAGGLLAYLVARKYDQVSSFIHKIPVWLRYVFILVVVLAVIFQKEIFFYDNPYRFDVIRSTIIAFLFTGLIALFIPADSPIKIKNRVLNYLGTISYGLYVYHILVVHMLLKYFTNSGILLDNWITVSLFVFVSFSGTVIVSSLSYYYFEKPFLRLRDRLSKHKV
jgi:peptidoglycan/LPS O-acetylase OafA/YrhL